MNDTPTVNSEPTVEEALKELREIFPGCAVSVQFSSNGQALNVARDWVYLRRRNKVVASGATLAEAMAQVRTWHKEQS